ncbi:MAG: LD-carboxypeptidase [Sporolactobacillus sp.]
MQLLKKGDTIGLIACSDGLRPDKDTQTLTTVEQVLHSLQLHTMRANTLFHGDSTPFSGSAKERASALMALFNNPHVRAIFDVSGGDSANQILPILDFEAIRRSHAFYSGISDLSVINNALIHYKAAKVFHYRINNLAGSDVKQQTRWFQDAFMEPQSIPAIHYDWLRGSQMHGKIIGGNLRCFLKLAGTSFFPDPAGKIIFLESLGGGPARIASLLAQLDQIGVFSACQGILLGTFSEMERKKSKPTAAQLVLEITDRNQLPVARTTQLGHGEDAIGVQLGTEQNFC